MSEPRSTYGAPTEPQAEASAGSSTEYVAGAALARAEEALAHAHIASLLSLYYQALDAGDLDRLEVDVMADDATWVVVQRSGPDRIEDQATGRTEVLRWFRTMFAGGVSMSEGAVRHFLSTHVIRVEGARAHSTSHLQAISATTHATLATGVAEAEHVRTPAGWRIRHYRVTEDITRPDFEALRKAFGLALR